jgi:O-antigen/teichoic acid export membrane protein
MAAAGRLIAYALAIGVVLLILLAVPVGRLLFRRLGVDGPDTGVRVFLVVGALTITMTLAAVSYRVLYAEQRGQWANLSTAVANVAGLVGVWLLTRYELNGGAVEWALGLWLGPGTLAGILAWLVIARRHPPRSGNADPLLTRSLVNAAWRFWGFALLSASTTGLDYAVMAQTLSSSQIIEYSAAARVFGLCFFIYVSLLQASWPLLSEAFAKGDVSAASRLLERSMPAGAMIVASCTLALIVLREPASWLLLGRSGIVMTRSLLILFGGLYLIRVWCDTYVLLLMSQTRMRVLWAYVPFQAVVSVSLQYLLAQRLGVNGIVLGVIISYLCTAVWVLPLAVHGRRFPYVRGGRGIRALAPWTPALPMGVSDRAQAAPPRRPVDEG